MGKPIKKAVALVITNDAGEILLVKRPSNDEDLPGVWGFPAGPVTSESDLTWEAAVIISAYEKLGVSVSVRSLIAEGKLDRGSYFLHMKLFSSDVLESDQILEVPNSNSDCPQYVTYRWVLLEGAIGFLRHAALQGSLCSALYLRCRDIFDDARIKKLGVQIISFTQIQEN